MNGTNATTFCEIEDKKQLRQLRQRPIGSTQQKRFNILISIKNDLFRCRNNVFAITKVEMKALRRKLYEIMNEKVGLTAKENEIFQECKATINKLRVSHSELFEVKINSKFQNPSTDLAVFDSNDFVIDSSDTNKASKIASKSETIINHKAKVELLSEPKKKIQKLSSDLAVHSSEIDNTTASTNEAETNNMILEVFRQAKEIIEYYSNQQDASALQLYR